MKIFFLARPFKIALKKIFAQKKLFRFSSRASQFQVDTLIMNGAWKVDVVRVPRKGKYHAREEIARLWTSLMFNCEIHKQMS